MYKNDDGQITFEEFISPFKTLDKKNRWVRIADIIPWQRLEERYAKRFCESNGTPAIKFRMAMGALIIKQMTGHSDDVLLMDIIENPYMQYLIGLHEFTITPPFSQSSVSNFRKYITAEMINEVNEIIFDTKTNGKDDGSGGSGGGDRSGGGDERNELTVRDGEERTDSQPDNKGILLLDATCAPAYIAYPTDVNLLNEAREKLEGMIDVLRPKGYNGKKPRTYREKAHKAYLSFVKQRKPSKKAVRKAIGQQLRFVRRDLTHVEAMIHKFGVGALSQRQQEWLETVCSLYSQQQQMYEKKTHTVPERIVSIGQPHVRPIVRGKASAAVEFGAKVSIHMKDGYAFIDKTGWDAYAEQEQLIPMLKRYRERNGCYPEAVLVDRIYRNRENRAFCKEWGIRISGPRLGRPPKETDKAVIKQAWIDNARRNVVEGKFGEGKTRYGLDRIMARLKDTSETVIAMSFFCLNLSRRLRVLLRLFSHIGCKVLFRFKLDFCMPIPQTLPF